MTKKNKRLFKNVLNMSNIEARSFFLKDESYCNFELPKYFKFGNFLDIVAKKIDGKKLQNFYKNGKDNHPRKYENVNHTILHNKDGKFAWRHIELKNPVIYVALVQAITEVGNWKTIVDRFKEFNKNKKIECMSLPIESITNGSDKSKQINKWWHDVEQKSIELSLEYEYIFKTDITDCYSSIYTHSIAWALHDKAEAKSKRYDKELLGNVIDDFFCDMSNGQTNGIPQGSSLTDFVSEIVLGYADILLTKKIDNKVKDYHIIRYRDDYRIFVQNVADGELIVKYLCEVLFELNLKINPSKTISSQNIVEYAIKEDKRFWVSRHRQSNDNLQNHLLIIHELASKYPNSGSLKKSLSKYSSAINNKKNIYDVMSLIGIIVDIAYNNPKVYSVCAAILSKLISCVKEKSKKLDIFKKIERKFEKIPNTEHLRIWLQRITLNIDKNYPYSEPLCRLILGEDVKIWNFEWLKDNFNKNLDVKSIIDNELIKSLPDVIDQEEVALFNAYD